MGAIMVPGWLGGGEGPGRAGAERDLGGLVGDAAAAHLESILRKVRQDKKE
jgi:hypothetical protein